MWMNRSLATSIAAVSMLVLPVCAEAASFVYAFGDSPSVQLQPGGSVTVNLYLQEIPDLGVLTSVINDEGGLANASVHIHQVSGGSDITITDIDWNPLFDDALAIPPVLSDYEASFDVLRDSGNPAGVAATPNVDIFQVLLGTATFTAAPGAAIGSNSQFVLTLTDLSAMDTWDRLYGASGLELDELNLNSAQADFTVIPEPIAMGMLGLGGLALSCRWPASRTSSSTGGQKLRIRRRRSIR